MRDRIEPLTVLRLVCQVESRLKGTFGATLVLRDTPRLPTVLEEEILPAWSGIYRPRLALDAVGGASGKTQTTDPPEPELTLVRTTN